MGTHDGASSRLYVDGQLIESLAQPGGLCDSGGTTNLLLGRRPHATAPEPYSGLLGGPLLIYDNALAGDVVRTLSGALLPGDLDGDGFVGGDDLDILRAFWGQEVTPGNRASGDPSGDGFVGGDDLDMVRADWGQGVPPTPLGPIPEPHCLILVATAALCVLFPTRRRQSRRQRLPR